MSTDEQDEEDKIPEGFHLQEESPHCLNMQRVEDFQAYLRGNWYWSLRRMLKAGGTDMKTEYGKVIKSFFWACKANKQTICNDAVAGRCPSKCEGSFMQSMEIKVERKRQCGPNDV